MTSFIGLHSSSFLDYAVGANGVFSVALGLGALVNPLFFLGAFDLEAKTPEARKVARDLLIVYAGRDIALGFGLTAAGYYGHKQIQGWFMAGVAVIAFLDGLVSKGNVEGGQWKHWFFVGLSLAISAGCFGYI